MTDSMQSPAGSGAKRPKFKPSWLFVGGTAAALVAGGLGLQLWRAQAGSAQETGKASVGKAQVGGSATPQRQTAAAKVTRNGRSISVPMDDVAKECLARVGNDVLESMLNRAVIQLACEEAGLMITEAEVDQEIIRIAKQFNIPTETWLQMLQTERNITPEQYKRDVIWPMLALKKLAGKSSEITDEDMHKAFVRQFGPRAKVRMIMLDNHRRANEVWNKASLHPDDFNRLAREHSVDPNSRAMEGLVPPIQRYAGNTELEEAAFRLKEGQISGIINVGFNRFVILKCEGFTEQKVQDINEVREMLEKDLREEKVQESVAKLFDQLKKSSRIDNYWTNTTTGDVKQVSATQAPTGEKGAVKQASGATPKPGTNVIPPSATRGATQPGTAPRPTGTTSKK